MLHFVMVGIGAVIFASMFAFVAACDRLVAPRTEEVEKP